ncbi:MAG: hypothetical protein IT378_27135 [Sandaracinaceae bacterium]|nr:hypothetical protein [Sandaracinaceae bacterium]
MNDLEPKIRTWLTRMTRGGETGDVLLGHLDVGGQPAQLGRWRLGEHVSEAELAQAASEMVHVACDDADGQSAHATQQYVLVFYNEQGRVAESRLPFQVQGAMGAKFGGSSGEGLSTEPATEKGLVGQLMRHNEMLVRSSWAAAGHVMGALERQVTSLMAQNEKLADRNFGMTLGYEGLLSDKTQRELAADLAAHQKKATSQFFANLFALAPAVVSQLGGARAPRALPAPAPAAPSPAPAAATPRSSAAGGSSSVGGPPSNGPPLPEPGMHAGDESLLARQLRSFMQTLSPEQFAAIQQALEPMQMIALGMLYQSLHAPGESETEPAE